MTTALYRRYRPDTFEQVIGQEHVTDPLRAALRANRVTHAYLFSGPRGCGKTTSARILARCLNCAQGPTDEPCGSCDSCRELATGGPGSLDVVEIDAASHGGVDDARDLRERATFAPVRDRYKVFIIDEAHMVTTQGFNALLKLVEEPPEHVKFVFATTEPERVIGTIRSRTHHYPFRLVPPDVLGPYLDQLCTEEHIGVHAGVIPLVMRAGGGSVRDTLSVLDQLMAGAVDDTVPYDTAVALLGYTDQALLDQSVDALAGGDGAAAYRVVERMVESGHDPRRFVEDLLQRLRDLLIIAVAGDGAAEVLTGTPADQLERMFVQARNWGPRQLSRAADLTDEALRAMTGATSPRLQLELLLGRILVPSQEWAAGHVPEDAPGGQASPMPRTVGITRGGAPVEDEIPSAGPRFGAREAREALARQRREKDGLQRDEGRGPQESQTSRVQAFADSAGDPAWPTPVVAGAPTIDRPAADTAAAGAPTTQTDGGPVGGREADMLRGRWDEVVERLASMSRVVWNMVHQNAQLGAVDGEWAVVLLPSAGHVANFNNSGRGTVVSDAIHEVTGLRLQVRADLGQSVGGRPVSTPSAPVNSPGVSSGNAAAPSPGGHATSAPSRIPIDEGGAPAPFDSAPAGGWGPVAEPGSGVKAQSVTGGASLPVEREKPRSGGAEPRQQGEGSAGFEPARTSGSSTWPAAAEAGSGLASQGSDLSGAAQVAAADTVGRAAESPGSAVETQVVEGEAPPSSEPYATYLPGDPSAHWNEVPVKGVAGGAGSRGGDEGLVSQAPAIAEDPEILPVATAQAEEIPPLEEPPFDDYIPGGDYLPRGDCAFEGDYLTKDDHLPEGDPAPPSTPMPTYDDAPFPHSGEGATPASSMGWTEAVARPGGGAFTGPPIDGGPFQDSGHKAPRWEADWTPHGQGAHSGKPADERPRSAARLAADARLNEEAARAASGSVRPSAAEDDSASLDDADVETSGIVGVPAVLELLGGTVIDVRTETEDW